MRTPNAQPVYFANSPAASFYENLLEDLEPLLEIRADTFRQGACKMDSEAEETTDKLKHNV